jgi:hypothetical protein
MLIKENEMTVRTKHVGYSNYTPTVESDKKIQELGGDVDDREITVQEGEGTRSVIRSWPSMESAQAWCDYRMSVETGASAEILVD